MVVAPEELRTCGLGNVCSSLNALSERDYGCCPFRKEIECIDLDAWEHGQGRHTDCTMDAVVGVADMRGTTFINRRLLLLEFRLDYKSTRNFDYGNMERKVSHSRDILAGNRVDPKNYFIYSDEVYHRARSEFAKKSRGCNGNVYKSWVAASPATFEKEFDDNSLNIPIDIAAGRDSLEKILNNDGVYVLYSRTCALLDEYGLYKGGPFRDDVLSVFYAINEVWSSVPDMAEVSWMKMSVIGALADALSE